MKKTILILLVSIIFSCNQEIKVDLDQILRNSENPELDMVFYELVNSVRSQRLYNKAIVDRAVDDGTPNSAIDTTLIYWNKSIFPNAKFIDGDSLFLNNEPDKIHRDYTKKYKNGYIEIAHPYFINADKGIAWVKVKYYRSNEIDVYHYILEKENNRYVVKEKEKIVMIKNNDIIFASLASYSGYFPYYGFISKHN